jgi:hypothetical protein
MSDNDNNNDLTKNDNLFDKLGLSVQYGEVEVGQEYPIYGIITDFLCDVPGKVTVMVNHNIELAMDIQDAEKVTLLKNRAFDPGIFVSIIEQTTPTIKGRCTTAVFGKTQTEIH